MPEPTRNGLRMLAQRLGVSEPGGATVNQPRLPLIALAVLLAAGASLATDPVKVPHRGAIIWDDLQQLQGDWRVVEQHLGNGVSNAIDPMQQVISIRGTSVRAEVNGKKVWESAFKL